MKLKFLLFTFTLGIALETLNAQDIHYSLFNMSPLTLNPALTGAYEGTARIGGIYRSQWSSVFSNPYKTPTFYIDAPIIRGFRKKDWVGIGLTTVNDEAGISKLKTGTTMLSASYHFALNKEGKTYLTLGLQGGSVQRKFSADELKFGDELQSGLDGSPIQSEDRSLSAEKSFLDFNVGLLLRTALDDRSGLEVGLAFNHITQPEYAFRAGNVGGSDANKRPMKIVGHAKYEADLTDKWSIAPTALFQNTGGATEIALQGWGGYQFNKDYKFNFGAGYRVSDAAQALLGLDYKSVIRVAASYDINVSSLTEASKYQGGFEIAAWYILKIYKKPNVKPAILCPQF